MIVMYKGQLCPMLKTEFLWGHHLCQIKYTEHFPTLGGGRISNIKTIWVSADEIKEV